MVTDSTVRRGLRYQPPVFSPVPFAALSAVAGAGFAGRSGRAAARLTDLLRSDYSADGVLLTNSGTAALQLAISLAAARHGADPIVAVPAFGCYDLATALLGAGARATLYDLDPATLAPDQDSLEDALRRGATAVVITPLYGVPVAWEPLEALAARHGALLIEDAAQGHGAAWQSRPLGSLGRLSILSFGRGKGWTGGAGGALLWRGFDLPGNALPDLKSASAIAGARSCVVAAAQWLLARPSLYGIPASIPWLGLGETVYHAPSRATSAAATTAALVLATREAALVEAGVRRQRGDWLRDRLPAGLTPPTVPPGGTPGWLRLPVRTAHASATLHRLRRLGIGSSYPAPLGTLPQLRPAIVPHTPAAWPGAETLVRELITLPTHSRLTEAELGRVARSLADPGEAA